MTARLLLILCLLSAAALAEDKPTKPAKPFNVKKGYKAADMPGFGGRFAFPDTWGIRPQDGQVVYDIEYRSSLGGPGQAHLVTIFAEPGKTQDLAGAVDEVKQEHIKQWKTSDYKFLRDMKTTLGGRDAWLLVYEAGQKGQKPNSSGAEIIYFDKTAGTLRLEFSSHKADWDMLMKSQFQPVVESFNWVDGK